MNSLQKIERKNLRAHTLNRLVRIEGKSREDQRSRKLKNLILKRLGICFLQKKQIAAGLLDFYELAIAMGNHQPTGTTAATQGQQ